MMLLSTTTTTPDDNNKIDIRARANRRGCGSIKGAANLSLLLICCCSLGWLIVGGTAAAAAADTDTSASAGKPNQSGSFKLTLGELLRQAGLGDKQLAGQGLTGEQQELIKTISNLYEVDDDLAAHERAILANKKLTTKDYLELKAIFRKHLVHSLAADKFAEKLRDSLDEQINKQNDGDQKVDAAKPDEPAEPAAAAAAA